MWSASTAKVTGTTCGRACADTAASRATRATPSRSLASCSVIHTRPSPDNPVPAAPAAEHAGNLPSELAGQRGNPADDLVVAEHAGDAGEVRAPRRSGQCHPDQLRGFLARPRVLLRRLLVCPGVRGEAVLRRQVPDLAEPLLRAGQILIAGHEVSRERPHQVSCQPA